MILCFLCSSLTFQAGDSNCTAIAKDTEKKNVSFSSTVATVFFISITCFYPGERKLLLQMVAKMLQQQFMLLQHQQQQPQLQQQQQQQQQHQQQNKIWKFFISLTRTSVDIFSAVTVLWPSQTQKNPLWVLLSFRAKTEKQKKAQIIFCTHTDTTHRDIHSNIKTHTHTHTQIQHRDTHSHIKIHSHTHHTHTDPKTHTHTLNHTRARIFIPVEMWKWNNSFDTTRANHRNKIIFCCCQVKSKRA